MSFILALDQGTSSSRGIVFDASGQIKAVGQREFDMHFPRDGWVEQDPEVLWQTTLEAGREAIARAGVAPSELAAVGVTNQRETTLLWDRASGTALHPAIVWQDRRTADRCERLRADGLQGLISEATGLLVDPYFSATKLAWLLDELPNARERAARGELCFGTVDSFVIWRLTKGAKHVTDATNASRTQLFDINNNSWHEELLRYHDIPAALLPTVHDCVADFGICDAEWFGAPLPILGVAGDQQAALIGQACFEPGMTKSTYGTGCFVINNTGSVRARSGNQLLTTIGYRLAGDTTYALEGSIFVAGQAVKWLRDKIGLIETAADSAAVLTRTGYRTGGVYVVPSFTGLGAPYWDAEARGLMTGLTLDTGADEIIAATLHSVGYQTAELLEAMGADGAPVQRLRIDGGMVVNDPLCQFLADVTGITVERPVVTETTALGAAMLAAIGAGLADDLSDAARLWQSERCFDPALDSDARTQLTDGWRRAVARARA